MSWHCFPLFPPQRCLPLGWLSVSKIVSSQHSKMTSTPACIFPYLNQAKKRKVSFPPLLAQTITPELNPISSSWWSHPIFRGQSGRNLRWVSITWTPDLKLGKQLFPPLQNQGAVSIKRGWGWCGGQSKCQLQWERNRWRKECGVWISKHSRRNLQVFKAPHWHP